MNPTTAVDTSSANDFSDLVDGNCCVVGLKWGDEGKGKIVDVLTEAADVVVRYCGGANAGHSVKIGEQKFATHLLPVGVFREGVMNYVGNGVVLDPAVILREIDTINGQGVAVSPDNLRVSYKAHVVMPYHQLADGLREEAAEGTAIGTTRRGIGPAYADKMTRSTAIRVADLTDENESRLKEKVGRIVEERRAVFEALYGPQDLDPNKIFDNYREYGERLRPYVSDIGRRLLLDREAGRHIVFEGAHAVLLDIDHGTFPYVTSSNCSSLGLFTGAGVPPRSVEQFVGVLKAYDTRVGGGPFPSELHDATADYIRERGHEYGTTTGRPRRVGWFDAVAARYSADLCGCTSLAICLLDVLSGLDEVKLCVGYDMHGERLDYFRADMDTLADVTPVFETLPGWQEDISTCRSFEELPANALKYIARVEELAGAPVKLVSVGPDRDQILKR